MSFAYKCDICKTYYDFYKYEGRSISSFDRFNAIKLLEMSPFSATVYDKEKTIHLCPHCQKVLSKAINALADGVEADEKML